jgi:hypothetical protein
MDRMGLDVQVVSPAPTEYHYWADPALAVEVCRALNEGVADVVGMGNPTETTLALSHLIFGGVLDRHPAYASARPTAAATSRTTPAAPTTPTGSGRTAAPAPGRRASTSVTCGSTRWSTTR